MSNPSSLSIRRSTNFPWRGWGILIGLLSLACHGEAPSNSSLRRAPTIKSVNFAKLPRPTYLATPQVRTIVGYTRHVLHLHDGHTLAVFSYSDNGSANWMFLIDARDLSAQRFDIPNHDVGSHSAALGNDGNIYIMPYASGRAYKFDTAKRQFTQLPAIGLPPGELTWGGIGDAHSPAIYFGTYPNACLGRYDVATGKVEIRPHFLPDATYVMDFSQDASGIHCRTLGSRDHWLTIRGDDFSVSQGNPPSAAPAFVPPRSPAPDKDILYPTQICQRRFGIGWPSGRLIEITAGGRTIVRGDSQAPAEIWFLEPIGDTALVGISHYGALCRFDLATNRFTRGKLANLSAGGNANMFLEAITPHCVIGSNYSQQNLFRIDPQSGKIEMFNSMIATVPGESSCAIGFGGDAYIGVYIHAKILKYDPQKPFTFGTNPRELASLFEHAEQTRPGDVVSDGRHLFFTTESQYGKLGGALAELDPTSGHVDTYPQPIKDQNLPSAAFDPKTGLVWLGTDRWGQQHSTPPTQNTAVIAAWDRKQHKVVKTISPWPQTDDITILGCTAEGTLVAASRGELALIDTTSASVLWRGASPFWPISKLRHGKDGKYYLLAGGVMYRWNFPTNTLTPVAPTDGCSYLTEYLPGKWAVANSTAVYRVEP